MKKLFRNVAILLCIIFIAPTILSCLPTVNSVSSVEASAKKAKLYYTKGTIGVQSSPEYIYIKNKKSSAKYTYTSSDPKVATVNKKGIITGVGTGQAKITVKETYKKKDSSVGTYKITVVNSSIKEIQATASQYDSYFPLSYPNFKATYTYVSSDTKIANTSEDGTLMCLGSGTTQISVTETYQGVARNLGTFSLTVLQSSINQDSASIEIEQNSENSLEYLIMIDNRSWASELKYSYESSDPTIASITKNVSSWGYEEYLINGIKLGTATITVYEEYKGIKRNVGTVSVTVTEEYNDEYEDDEYDDDDDDDDDDEEYEDD